MQLGKQDLREIRCQTIARFLKMKRLAAALSQKEACQALGYSDRQFVSNWERGISSPPLNKFQELSKLYGFSTEELFEVIRSYQDLCTQKFVGYLEESLQTGVLSPTSQPTLPNREL